MPSPKPLPPNLKLLQGRGNGRDSGGRTVKPTPGFTRLPPEAPEWLDGEALAMWERTVPELQRLQVLKPIDQAALTAYCLTWARLVQAQDIIKRSGILQETERGTIKHPAVLIAEGASKELRAWAAEFGLTPSSENRLGKAAGAGDDDDDDNPFAS